LLIVLGDRSTGSAAESRGASKKTLSRTTRSCETPRPDNEHSSVKSSHSYPTDSSSCGHLALANKLSHKYKHTPRLGANASVTDKCQGDIEYSEGNDEDAAYKPEKLHQRLKRQLAFGDNNYPRAASSSQTYNVTSRAEQSSRDVGGASNDPSVDLLTSRIMTDVSSCSNESSHADPATQFDTHSSLPCTNRVNQTMSILPQRPLFSDAQQFVAARRIGQDHAIGDRISSPFLTPAASNLMDNMYLVRPVVIPCDCATDLQSYRQYPTPPLVPRIHLSPSWPHMYRYVYQPRSYRPQNTQMRHSVISPHRFLHR